MYDRDFISNIIFTKIAFKSSYSHLSMCLIMDSNQPCDVTIKYVLVFLY